MQKQRLAALSLARSLDAGKKMSLLSTVERWRGGVLGARIEAEMTAHEAGLVQELKGWAMRLVAETAASWGLSAVHGVFRAWCSLVTENKRAKETAVTLHALTLERRALEAQAAKARLKGFQTSPLRAAMSPVTRVPSPSLRHLVNSPGKRRLALVTAWRGIELAGMRKSGVSGAIFRWRRSMQLAGYKSQILSLREEVNEAWLEAERGIEEMRLEASKERARVLELHAKTYKELQVASDS